MCLAAVLPSENEESPGASSTINGPKYVAWAPDQPQVEQRAGASKSRGERVPPKARC